MEDNTKRTTLTSASMPLDDMRPLAVVNEGSQRATSRRPRETAYSPGDTVASRRPLQLSLGSDPLLDVAFLDPLRRPVCWNGEIDSLIVSYGATTDCEIAWVAVALRDLRVRDDVWARMDPVRLGNTIRARAWTVRQRRSTRG